MTLHRVPLHIAYADGNTATVSATQYGFGQWATYCAHNGLPIPKATEGTDDRTLLDAVMMRYVAWVELARNANGTFPAFNTWDRGVDEVTSGDPVPVDPTGQGSGGSSP